MSSIFPPLFVKIISITISMIIRGLKNEEKIGLYRRIIFILDELENESKMKSLIVTENLENRLLCIEKMKKRVGEINGDWGSWVKELEEEIKQGDNCNNR